MEEISLRAQELFHIGGFYITNAILLTLVAGFVLIVFSVVIRSKVKIIPGKLQGTVEMGLESLLGLMESVLGSMEKAEKYLPLVATIFIFILVSNLLGIFPGVGSLTFYNGSEHVPLFRSPASDLNFTLAFAVISVIVTNIIRMTSVGVFKHLGKYLNFKNYITFFIFILEIFVGLIQAFIFAMITLVSISLHTAEHEH